MIIPKFWGKAHAEARKPDGSRIPVSKWFWSEHSVADAEERARERLQGVISRIATGHPFPQRYAYAGDLPLREEVVREIDTGDDEHRAVITRNAYGALVLNTDAMMFVDIDLPEKSPEPGGPAPDVVKQMFGLVKSLFGGEKFTEAAKPTPPAAEISPGDAVIKKVEAWVRRNPGWGFRIYRTASGFRLIATHQLFTPDDASTLRQMQELDCDPLYLKLCRSQKSFRARLTPKPWRVGLRAPVVKFPFETAGKKSEISRWVAEYESASEGYATCHFVKAIGNTERDDRIGDLIAVHDEISRSGRSDLPLA